MQDLSSADFKNTIAKELQNSQVKRMPLFNVKNMPLIIGKQCMYIVDWKQSKITFSRGVKEMLGYNAKEFNMDLVLNYFHPEDTKFVNRIIKGAVRQSVKINKGGQEPFLNLTFRLCKKDGNYLKVLRKSSTYQVDVNGRLISNFSIITDISFISNNNKVEWDVYANNLDIEDFNTSIRKEFTSFFTPRESNVVRLLLKRKTSLEISKILFISTHTVASHRKNILRKSRCHNVNELNEFCIKNGIV